MLKVSAFYLEKQKSFIPKKYFFGRTAKIHPKDGVCRLNFPEGFDAIMPELRATRTINMASIVWLHTVSLPIFCSLLVFSSKFADKEVFFREITTFIY